MSESPYEAVVDGRGWNEVCNTSVVSTEPKFVPPGVVLTPNPPQSLSTVVSPRFDVAGEVIDLCTI